MCTLRNISLIEKSGLGLFLAKKQPGLPALCYLSYQSSVIPIWDLPWNNYWKEQAKGAPR